MDIVTDGHKFCEPEELPGNQKMQFLPSPAVFGTTVGVIPLDFQ